MARTWNWVWRTVGSASGSAGGFDSSTGIGFDAGWAVQRVIGQGGYWNSMSFSSGINPQHYLPIPFRWQVQVHVIDGGTTVATPILREGVAPVQIWQADNDGIAGGWATWALPPGAMDYDVTIRHTFKASTNNSVSSYFSIVPAIPTSLPDFKLPDGDFGGTWHVGALITTP